MAVKTKQERQSDADKRYRLAHPEKVKEKDRKRYRENTKTERLRNQSYYMQNREAQRIRHRNTRHHITQEWFDAQMAEQDGRCLLCCKPFVKTPHIDHDHRCCSLLKSCDKCRRGLLCGDCNLGLGRFKDNIETLERAIQYLRRHNGLGN